MIKKITNGEVDIYLNSGKEPFNEMFNPVNGKYMRTGILEKDANDKIIDTNVDPFMRSFPNLLDIGIMGAPCKARHTCKAQCYQGEQSRSGKDMSLEVFKSIIDQSKDKVQQIALGGSGNPDDHENFEEILKYARENGIVPSYTTSGINVDGNTAELTKVYCGAVAVSHAHDPSYRDRAINLFIDAGCITNIHFVVSNDTIDEAITRIKTGDFPEGISNVIFLTYKPIGNANYTGMLKYDSPKVRELALAIDSNKNKFGVGVDACMVPLLLNHCSNINLDSISSCDASTYSAYITADNWILPCSMDVHNYAYGVDLSKMTMQDAWNSDLFEKFRSNMRNACPDCKDRTDCYGGCISLLPEMTLCAKEERDSYNV